MKEMIEMIVRNLVDKGNDIRVNEVAGENVTLFEIIVPKSQIGKIVGKEGNLITAIRRLCIASACKTGGRVSIEIIE